MVEHAGCRLIRMPLLRASDTYLLTTRPSKIIYKVAPRAAQLGQAVPYNGADYRD